MEIATITRAFPAAELRLNGRFDAHEAERFRAALHKLLIRQINQVDVQMAGVEFVDSTALAELVKGMKHCREHGGDLVLLSPSTAVQVILQLTKLDAAFTIVRTADS